MKKINRSLVRSIRTSAILAALDLDNRDVSTVNVLRHVRAALKDVRKMSVAGVKAAMTKGQLCLPDMHTDCMHH